MIGTVERVVLSSLEARPWKNGAGTTREIAVQPRDAGVGDFDWRLSVAEVDRAAPFSSYPGIDRVIVLLSGDGLRLSGDLAHDLVEPCVPLAFAGECAVEGMPLGGPTMDFNVMTRRGAWRSTVDAHRAAASVGGSDAGVLLCVRGRWSEPSLDAGEALLWREARPAFRIAPASSDALLLAVKLLRDPLR